MRKEYHAAWLPLDEKDEGYTQYAEAEKIRTSLDWQEGGLLGGLDHIEIGTYSVRYVDRGVNGKTADLIINLKTKETRIVRHG